MGAHPAIPPEYIDSGIVVTMLHEMAALLTDERSEIRNHAVRALGLMQTKAYHEEIIALLRHDDVSTRIAALRALAELEAREAIPVIAELAGQGTPIERRTAVETLGRLQATESLPVLAESVCDSDPQVRQTAVTALGDIGGEEARELLQRLSQGEEKVLARAAVKTLHTSPHFRTRRKVDPALHAIREQVSARLLGGQVNPTEFISLPAAIAALPEIRVYREREVTRFIAQACIDYATTRRQLIMDKFMEREHDRYELTDTGKTIWRVEHYVTNRYLQCG
jgi:hypothetical protein